VVNAISPAPCVSTTAASSTPNSSSGNLTSASVRQRLPFVHVGRSTYTLDLDDRPAPCGPPKLDEGGAGKPTGAIEVFPLVRLLAGRFVVLPVGLLALLATVQSGRGVAIDVYAVHAGDAAEGCR